MMRTAIVVLTILPVVAFARQPPALHDVAWYEGHPAERAAALRICHGDATYSRLLDCQNAEAAAAVGDLPWNRKNNGLNFLHDPAYWRANPAGRDTILMQCARRAIGDEMAYPY